MSANHSRLAPPLASWACAGLPPTDVPLVGTALAPDTQEGGYRFLQVLDFSVALNISETCLCGMSAVGQGWDSHSPVSDEPSDWPLLTPPLSPSSNVLSEPRHLSQSGICGDQNIPGKMFKHL